MLLAILIISACQLVMSGIVCFLFWPRRAKAQPYWDRFQRKVIHPAEKKRRKWWINRD